MESFIYPAVDMVKREGVWICIFRNDKKALCHNFSSVLRKHMLKCSKSVYVTAFGYINKAEKGNGISF